MTSVLVVEDEAVVAADIASSLKSFGYAVPATAASGEDAVARAREQHPDLVLMDIRLRGKLDGIEAATIIKNELRIPTLYVTAYGDDATFKRAEPTAPIGYLLKPFNPLDLHIAISLGMYREQTQQRLSRQNRRLLDQTLRLATTGEARDQQVSEVAHDLRVPLATAKMAAERLWSIGHSVEMDALAQRIIRNLQRSDRLVQDLLDAQRLRSGHSLDPQLAMRDLVQIAKDALEDLRSMHGDRFVLAGARSVQLRCDADLVTRALINLATNAVKYGDRRASIEISVRRDDDQAELSVHNEGTHISREDQQRLFSPFYRNIETRELAPGWGLGLTVVAGCARAHGGRVEVTSLPHLGTTFQLRLPVDPAPALSKTRGAAMPA